MKVLYASDDKFAPILSVSIASLCEANQNESNIDIFVIDDQISGENKHVLENVVARYKRSISFKQVIQKEELKTISLNTDRGSLSQYSRLFIQDCLPDCDRILYLDCDTLIVDSLDELYSADLSGKTIGGVEDAFSIWHRRALCLEENDIYINSGVMLIDLKKWKSENIEKMFLDEIIRRKGRFLQGDQGLINRILKGNIKKLSLRYDLMTYHYDFTYSEMIYYRKPYKYYSETEIETAKNDPAIIHFTSSFASMRPWQSMKSNHPFFPIWKSKYEDNGYMIITNPHTRFSFQSSILPRRIILLLARLFHSYIKPKWWLLNDTK